MNIAFYAPLKSPNHPVASGDRLMARMLMSALQRKGHSVGIASELRSFSRSPGQNEWAELNANAALEVARISRLWRDDAPPDLWFCYHPYYKAPDLIGPKLADAFGLAYATAESSYAAKRDGGPWAEWQDCVKTGLEAASVNICFTERDRSGIVSAVPGARIASVKPFIDTARFAKEHSNQAEAGLRLMTVAMMREGDKFDSYVMLAKALARLPKSLAWNLWVIGDGPKALEVKQAFADLPSERIKWLGARSEAQVTDLLARGSIYVWPGCGEAYGLAYLEAQAMGLPVVAQNIAGVPEVVLDGLTGILTPPDDIGAYSAAIVDLLTDHTKRQTLATAARKFVLEQRSLDRAAGRIDAILRQSVDLNQ